jgi:hypothetical protein
MSTCTGSDDFENAKHGDNDALGKVILHVADSLTRLIPTKSTTKDDVRGKLSLLLLKRMRTKGLWQFGELDELRAYYHGKPQFVRTEVLRQEKRWIARGANDDKILAKIEDPRIRPQTYLKRSHARIWLKRY